MDKTYSKLSRVSKSSRNFKALILILNLKCKAALKEKIKWE